MTTRRQVSQPLKIWFLASEATPFAKTGGLADVAGSLPAALKSSGADVRLVLPLYRTVREKGLEVRQLPERLEIPLGETRLPAALFQTRTEDGVPVYLIGREDLYDRPNLYGNGLGDYYDNLERFAFYCHGALRLAEALSFRPDVIHCHDWQTGLVPALLKGPYGDWPNFAGTASVFTLHNIGYQGLFPVEKLPMTGLSRPDFFHPEGIEYWGRLSLLKAGIVYAGAITTVSPRYAQEIRTPAYGMGMEGVLQRRRAFLHGILNGVDYRVWDPARDSHLPARYSPANLAGKRECKKALLREMGLASSLVDRPLAGMISRLDAQKGLDLLLEILDDLLGLEVGLVVLGAGDERIRQALKKAAEKWPGRVGLKFGLDEPLAHRIMAGTDLFLIPSRYEPCGLTQMYALKYGSVPVVRATGGLDDTVLAFTAGDGQGNGFKFGPFASEDFLRAAGEAVTLFRDAGTWKRLMANGMQADFSWERSARTYLELYESLLRGAASKPRPGLGKE
jgi:starch synthase